MEDDSERVITDTFPLEVELKIGVNLGQSVKGVVAKSKLRQSAEFPPIRVPNGDAVVGLNALTHQLTVRKVVNFHQIVPEEGLQFASIASNVELACESPRLLSLPL